MAITVLVPTALRAFTDQKSEVAVEGNTVASAIAALAEAYPDIKRHLYQDEENLRSFINVFVGDTNIKNLNGLNTALSDGSEIMLVPAIAGGCRTYV
ncbi:MAG: MoaD/ThiS family protein [Helicobacteraceae bacterium]|jgi:adenylyltransferase/sulfurtransferase|nr:MoaD/ThiS family protein [Helicobacteraceae bacterium]